jgi:hypothetical protein
MEGQPEAATTSLQYLCRYSTSKQVKRPVRRLVLVHVPEEKIVQVMGLSLCLLWVLVANGQDS